MFIISQVIIFLSFLVGIIANQAQSRSNILRIWSVAALLSCIHFFVLGEYVAATFVFVTFLRFVISSITTNIRWMFVFFVVASFNLYINYSEMHHILSFLATIIGTIGSFQKNVYAVRVGMFAASSTWIIHNLIVFSPVAVLMEFFFIVSNVIGTYRLKKETNPI
jgi:hypothetical protein